MVARAGGRSARIGYHRAHADIRGEDQAHGALRDPFATQRDDLWPHLSRFTGLLVILNISLFALTELVTREGYYYTFFSLACLGLVELLLLVPHGLFDRLWLYLLCLGLVLLASYFLVASGWFWVVTHRI